MLAFASSKVVGALLSLFPTNPFLEETRMETHHWPSSPLLCSHFQAPLGTTKIWDLMSWQRDECIHSSGICFKLSIKISTILEKEKKSVQPWIWQGGVSSRRDWRGRVLHSLFSQLLGSKGRWSGDGPQNLELCCVPPGIPSPPHPGILRWQL